MLQLYALLIFDHSSCHKIQLPIFVNVTPFRQELAYFVFVDHSSCPKIQLPIFVNVTPFRQELAYFVFVPVAPSSQ